MTERSANPAKTCCWPKCAKPGFDPLPLCLAHLNITVDTWQKLEQDPEAAKRGFHVIATGPWKSRVETRTRPTDGTIYYLRTDGYYKIGWTGNLEKRMRAYSPGATLLAVHPGTMADEKALHRRFQHLLGRGDEFFFLSQEISDHIDRVIAEHGQPPAVTCGGKAPNRTAGRPKSYIGGPNRGALATKVVRG